MPSMLRLCFALRIAVAVLVATLTGFASAGQTSILNVDFNSDFGVPLSPTTTATDANGVGFQAFNPSDAPAKTFTGLNSSLTSGSVTVTFGDGWAVGGRHRDIQGFGGFTFTGTFRDLYRDFVWGPEVTGSQTPAVGLTLTGLKPNTTYVFAFHGFELENNLDTTVETRILDMTPGGATNGLTTSAFYAAADPSASITDFSSPSGGSGSFTVRSNAQGILAFGFSKYVTNPHGHDYAPRLNGFFPLPPKETPSLARWAASSKAGTGVGTKN